jgi:hypothetical protein
MSVSYGGDSITFADGSVNSSGFIGHRNRIINGAMVIDQRNAGASVTQGISQAYTIDRWACYGTVASKFTVQQNAGSVTPPAGYSNYLGVTSSSAYSIGATDIFRVVQYIEGFNTADLGFGAAGATTVTLSFWVRSSLTGTFGGILGNSSVDYNYPFSYTISSANTWEQKSITITGATSGTWLKTNGIGFYVVFGLGVGSTYSAAAGSWTTSVINSATGATSVVGTNGATFYITGVQLERGSTASSFEYRSYGAELALCQRYYEIGGLWFQSGGTPSSQGTSAYFSVSKRSTPAVTFTNTAYNAGAGLTHYTPSISGYNTLGSFAYYFVPSGNSGFVTSNWIAAAEL